MQNLRPTLTHNQKIHSQLAALIFLIGLTVVNSRDLRAESQTRAVQSPHSSGPVIVRGTVQRIVQGTITAIQGALVTLKSADAYPGKEGVHAHFVTAGPTFNVDISQARLLLPDGKQPDQQELAVGDHVLMLLNGSPSASPAPNGPGNVPQTFSASTIERLACGDKVVTH